jgi:poly(3-hydroxybutyrate) depolymerase
MYYAYEWQRSMLAPMRALAAGGLNLSEQVVPVMPFPALRHFQALCQLLAHGSVTHERPEFELDHEVAASTPFCNLLRFRKKDAPPQPRVLVASPLSGHFATLLAGTVQSLVQDHDVYLTDWLNMRDVPETAGPFGFDEYVEHLMRFQEHIGPGGHMLAVCQPCVPALAAVAVMAEQQNPATPRSMTLMAGPIDARINPTAVNHLATARPLDWFKTNLITVVPFSNRGAGRSVYPGFLQLMAFMSMQPQRHVRAHLDLYDHIANGRIDEAEGIAEFYREYFAVLDLSAEFYLETVQWIFQEHRLAKGELTYRGSLVDPGLIRRTALLTVEGARDDICAPGQTLAAHDLCTGLRPYMKRHHLQAGVGHYGVFSGKRWETQVYPIVQNFILSMDETQPTPSRRATPVLKLVGNGS